MLSVNHLADDLLHRRFLASTCCQPQRRITPTCWMMALSVHSFIHSTTAPRCAAHLSVP